MNLKSVIWNQTKNYINIFTIFYSYFKDFKLLILF